jgi:hypothetical protein
MTAFIIVLVVAVLLMLLLVISSYKDNSVLSPRLSEIASAFQNFTVIFSIIGTGAWAIYTFDALNQREEAELRYKDLQNKIRDTESTTINISTNVINYSPITKDHQKGLIIEVNIVNKGSKKIEYDLTNNPLKVYKIEAQGDELGYTELLQPTLYSEVAPLGQNNVLSTPLNKWISLTESSRSLSYFVTVEPDSLYYIVFSSPDTMKKEELTVIDSDNEVDKTCTVIDECKWFVSKYVFTETDKGNLSD